MTHQTATKETTAASARYLREPDVLARVPFSKPTLHRLCAKGQFPKPVKIGSRAVAWRADEIDAWDEQIKNERDAAEVLAPDSAA